MLVRKMCHELEFTRQLVPSILQDDKREGLMSATVHTGSLTLVEAQFQGHKESLCVFCRRYKSRCVSPRG